MELRRLNRDDVVPSGPGKAENIVSHLNGFVLYTVKYSVRLKSYMLWLLGWVYVEIHEKNVIVGKTCFSSLTKTLICYKKEKILAYMLILDVILVTVVELKPLLLFALS